MIIPDTYPRVLPIERAPLRPLRPFEALTRQARIVAELTRRHETEPVADRLRSIRADIARRIQLLSLDPQD